MRSYSSALALLLLAMIAAPSSASAQTTDFAIGARPGGMGRAANAVSRGTDGLFQNPAGISLKTGTLDIEGAYAYTQIANILSAAVVDPTTNPSVSAGFGAGYSFDNDGSSSALDLRLPIAIPLVAERVSFGVAGRYVITTEESVQIQNGFTLDAGAIFRIVDQLHLGVVGKNLIPLCAQQNCRGNTPVLLGGGVSYLGREFVAAVDVEASDLSTDDALAIDIQAGAEYTIQNMVPIRLGFRRDGATTSNHISAGLGWSSPAAAVNLSYEHDLSQNRVGLVMLGISAFLRPPR